MFKIEGKNIKMHQGDFGIKLPIEITNVLESDNIKFKIYEVDNTEILDKDLVFENEKWTFELTENETNDLKEKTYLYKIVQFRDGVLQNTINENSLFEVK